jgi:hypothetical protein
MSDQMTPYDRRAWAEIEKWRASRLGARSRSLVPGRVRSRMTGTAQGAKARFDSLPGADKFESLFVSSLGGLLDVGSRAAMASVRDKAVVKAFKKQGHDIVSIEDISKLALQDIDRVKPNLGLLYSATATIEGAAAGFAVSGGEIVAAGGSILGAGAGAAPGIGTVVGVMAADAAAVLVASNRAVAHIAAYYGYDLDRHDERLFALAVLSLGTAAGAGKSAAYIEVNKLVQALARRATWQQLRENVVTRVVDSVFTRLGYRITQRKLGQAVPVVGTVIGAGMNAKLFTSVTDDADHIYRERFLRERYGLDLIDVGEEAPDGDNTVVDISQILDEEDAREDEIARSESEDPDDN